MKKILNNEFLTLCIAILLSFLSSFANQTFIFNDRFCFVQALMLMPAIAMGALIKARSIHVNYWSGFLAVSCFILGIVIHVLLQLPIPIVAQSISLSINTFFSYLFLSYCGIFSFLFISKLINSNIILERLGKSSIIIYMVSNLLMFICEKYIKDLIYPDNWFNVFLFYLITIFFAISGCLVLEKAFMSSRLRIILGKF